MNQQIYTVMKQLYSKYTAEEIATVVLQIRREIQEQQEQRRLKTQFKLIQGKRKDEVTRTD
jgi:hypothetical protein